MTSQFQTSALTSSLTSPRLPVLPCSVRFTSLQRYSCSFKPARQSDSNLHAQSEGNFMGAVIHERRISNLQCSTSNRTDFRHKIDAEVSQAQTESSKGLWMNRRNVIGLVLGSVIASRANYAQAFPTAPPGVKFVCWTPMIDFCLKKYRAWKWLCPTAELN